MNSNALLDIQHTIKIAYSCKQCVCKHIIHYKAVINIWVYVSYHEYLPFPSASVMISALDTVGQSRAQIAELIQNSPTPPETIPVQLHYGPLCPLWHSCRWNRQLSNTFHWETAVAVVWNSFGNPTVYV